MGQGSRLGRELRREPAWVAAIRVVLTLLPTAMEILEMETVDVGDPATTVEHEEETCYFCSAGCAEAFEAAPSDHPAEP